MPTQLTGISGRPGGSTPTNRTERTGNLTTQIGQMDSARARGILSELRGDIANRSGYLRLDGSGGSPKGGKEGGVAFSTRLNLNPFRSAKGEVTGAALKALFEKAGYQTGKLDDYLQSKGNGRLSLGKIRQIMSDAGVAVSEKRLNVLIDSMAKGRVSGLQKAEIDQIKSELLDGRRQMQFDKLSVLARHLFTTPLAPGEKLELIRHLAGAFDSKGGNAFMDLMRDGKLDEMDPSEIEKLRKEMQPSLAITVEYPLTVNNTLITTGSCLVPGERDFDLQNFTHRKIGEKVALEELGISGEEFYQLLKTELGPIAVMTGGFLESEKLHQISKVLRDDLIENFNRANTLDEFYGMARERIQANEPAALSEVLKRQLGQGDLSPVSDPLNDPRVTSLKEALGNMDLTWNGARINGSPEQKLEQLHAKATGLFRNPMISKNESDNFFRDLMKFLSGAVPGDAGVRWEIRTPPTGGIFRITREGGGWMELGMNYIPSTKTQTAGTITSLSYERVDA